MNASPRRRLWITAGIALALVVFAVVYGLFDPEQSKWFPKCLFYVWTGYKCPGCGSQRALHQLLGGHIAQAIRYNAFLVASIPLLVFLFSAEWLRTRWPRYYRISRSPVLGWSILAVVLLWWVLRNIFGW